MRRPGTDDEDAAARHLLDLGYTLLGRRIRAADGELDLVALDRETLVVVEVKRRSQMIDAELAVTRDKLARMRRATEAFVQESALESREVRFDVIAIDDAGLRHHKGIA